MKAKGIYLLLYPIALKTTLPQRLDICFLFNALFLDRHSETTFFRDRHSETTFFVPGNNFFLETDIQN